MLVAIIVFLIFIVPIGILAHRMNRDWRLWVALGLLNGPLALIILSFMSYLCPHCNESFAHGSTDGIRCGSCGKPDRVTRADEPRLEAIRHALATRNQKLKVKGVTFSVIESMGATRNFVGIDALERYALGSPKHG